MLAEAVGCTAVGARFKAGVVRIGWVRKARTLGRRLMVGRVATLVEAAAGVMVVAAVAVVVEAAAEAI